MSFDVSVLNLARQNTTDAANKCIKSIKLCLHDTENVINVLIKLIKSKNNSNDNDIEYLEKTYLPQIKNLQTYYNTISADYFDKDIKAKTREITELYKKVGTKITAIINRNNVTEISKIMSNMPLLVTQVFSDLKDYTIATMKEISTDKKEMLKANKNKIDKAINENIMPFSEIDQNGILNPIISGSSSVFNNLWKIITWDTSNNSGQPSKNPITNAAYDASQNIENLGKRFKDVFGGANGWWSGTENKGKNITMGDIGTFFTSNEFLSTTASVLTIVALIAIARKAFKKIARWFGGVWHSIWGDD